MNNIGPRSNITNALNAYKYPPGLTYDRNNDSNRYLNPYTNYDAEHSGVPKSTYKYTYYKNYPEN